MMTLKVLYNSSLFTENLEHFKSVIFFLPIKVMGIYVIFKNNGTIMEILIIFQ